jgi:transposase
MTASPSTLIRLEAAPCAAPASPRALGVDEYAFRKRHSYGTIHVDLETRRALDLLPDRSAECLARWLKAHPGAK